MNKYSQQSEKFLAMDLNLHLGYTRQCSATQLRKRYPALHKLLTYWYNPIWKPAALHNENSLRMYNNYIYEIAKKYLGEKSNIGPWLYSSIFCFDLPLQYPDAFHSVENIYSNFSFIYKG